MRLAFICSNEYKFLFAQIELTLKQATGNFK